MIDSYGQRATCTVLLGALLCFACNTERQFVSTDPVVLPVRSTVLERAPFKGELSVLGTVRPAETVPLTTAAGGVVEYPPRFKRGLRTGERVSAGETVAILDSGAVRLAVAEALLNAESDSAELQRAQTGFDAGLISRADLDRLETLANLSAQRLASAREQADRLTLVAPRGGRLIVNDVYPPATEVAPGTTLAQLAVDGPPRVEGWAAASGRDLLRGGQPARFVMPGSDSPGGRGVVREVSPVVDTAGTVRVILGVTDENGLPAPGEGVEVRIEVGAKREALSVPLEALTLWSGGHAAFVLEPFGQRYRARRVSVQVGLRNDQQAQIVEGLNEGDRVAVAGVSQLTDGALVAEAAVPNSPASVEPE